MKRRPPRERQLQGVGAWDRVTRSRPFRARSASGRKAAPRPTFHSERLTTLRTPFLSALALLLLCLPQASSAQTTGEVRERPSADARSLPSSPADDEYELGPEDVLELQVWGRPDLTGDVTVGVSGEIQAPLLGAIRAAGRTPAELTEDLTERYQLLDPSITEVLASVAEYNSRTLTILGAVGSPGVYGFREMPDLWDALLTAGGPVPEAELAQVQIVRSARGEGEARTVRVDLSRGIDGTPSEALPVVRPKDTILVPTADEDVPLGDQRYHVVGAVNSPGVYRLSTARNVLEAISVSGGPGAEANLESVRLVRLTSEGTTSFEFDLENYVSQADPLANIGLRAGDTISVPERGSTLTDFTEALRSVAPFLSLATTIILATR